MTAVHSQYDILILGGGPAGSTLGALLAKDGLNVAIVEREQMPRPHVGESLIPGVLPALASSGALAAVESAGFTQKYGATYIWGRTREPWTGKFSEVYPDQAFAYQVDRAKFDKILLDHAASEGADVYENTTALGPLGSSDHVYGARVRNESGPEFEMAADLTIDATGQNALFGRHFRTRQFNEELRHVALYGHWSGGHQLPDIIESKDANDAGNILIVTVPDGWIWHIPIAHTMRSVGLVTEPSAVAELNAADRTAYYLKQVRACPEMSALLGAAEWISDSVTTLSDWSFFCSNFAGPGYFLVGDAACFIDPILSTGVTLAVNGAVRAARAIRTVRESPWLQELTRDWYDTEYRGIATDFADLATHWYGGNADAEAWFWRAKQLADPSRSFSIRQAFVHLSSGITETRDDSGQLRSAGGYSPRQLELIYENLNVDLDEAAKADVAESESRFAATTQPSQSLSATAMLDGRPRRRSSISFRAHLTEYGATLRPITRVTRIHPNAGPQHRELSIMAMPVLEEIDGRRTGLDIAARLRHRYAATTIEPELQNLVTTTLMQLTEIAAIDIG